VDHLNTPRLVANSSSTTVWRWEQQEPFGVNAPDENPSSVGMFEFPLRFPGQYADKETNLYYNYFRDYDAIAGRYVESDPIGLDGGINTFAYVSAYPVGLFDSLGLAQAPPDPSTFVCRGGMCTAALFSGGTGVTMSGTGLLYGVSVNTMVGKSIAQLACGIKNGKIGITTTGQIQAMGGSIVPKPTPQNPYHATVNGLTPAQLQALFTAKPPIANPSRGLSGGALGALGAVSSILQFAGNSACTQGSFGGCFCSLSASMSGSNPMNCTMGLD
jgi:RHS repeat-associated protein